MLQRAESPSILSSVEASRSFFAPSFSERSQSRLMVAHVDEEARCIHLATYEEAEGFSDLPVRRIIGDAIRHDSAGIIIAHNHPVEDALPSRLDRIASRALSLAADAIDLAVLDHLIFSGRECLSFRRLGLL